MAAVSRALVEVWGTPLTAVVTGEPFGFWALVGTITLAEVDPDAFTVASIDNARDFAVVAHGGCPFALESARIATDCLTGCVRRAGGRGE